MTPLSVGMNSVRVFLLGKTGNAFLQTDFTNLPPRIWEMAVGPRREGIAMPAFGTLPRYVALPLFPPPGQQGPGVLGLAETPG